MTEEPKPSLLCRLIGHRWESRVSNESIRPGHIVTVISQIPNCTRCGVPNPNHNPEEPEMDWPTVARTLREASR